MDNYLAAYFDLLRMKDRLGQAAFNGLIPLDAELDAFFCGLTELMDDFEKAATLAEIMA